MGSLERYIVPRFTVFDCMVTFEMWVIALAHLARASYLIYKYFFLKLV